MRSSKLFATVVAVLVCAPALADDVKVGIGISGWTGFAPLTLAKEAGIFKKNGLDVALRKIPQKDRHLAIASGDIQCAATTVETWISWNANGVATKQIFQLDKSLGEDGMAVRSDQGSEGQDGRGVRARYLALFRTGLDAQEEWLVGQGCHGREP
jgi:NitT/TauT family transport system substrate-binding protein